MLVNCSGIPVVEGAISMPAEGAWWAELVLDGAGGQTLQSGQACTIASADGNVNLVGTVRRGRSGLFLGSIRVRVVGGAGGLSTLVRPRQYQQATLKIPLLDALSDGGEKLSSATDPQALATPLSGWVMLQQAVGAAVRSLTMSAIQAQTALATSTPPAIRWRVLPDGTVWVGPETWSAVRSSYAWTLINRVTSSNRVEIGSESPLVLPGQSFSTFGNVSYVVHRIKADQVRSSLWLE